MTWEENASSRRQRELLSKAGVAEQQLHLSTCRDNTNTQLQLAGFRVTQTKVQDGRG